MIDINAWLGLKRFRQLPSATRRIVFYSEGTAYWPHLSPVIMALLQEGLPVCYVSSEREDEGLALNMPAFTSFYIGRGAARTLWFLTLEARLVVLTMPGLHTSFLRRSPHVRHYAYIFHAASSLHAYQIDAWDFMDSLLLVGPQQKAEFMALQALRPSLAGKTLFDHGYARIDGLIPSASGFRGVVEHVVIAPTWGQNSLLNHSIEALIQALLDAGYTLTLRPHPHSLRFENSRLHKLRIQFGSQLQWDTRTNIHESLTKADLLVTDISSVMFDFALGLGKPVLRIETPLSWKGCAKTSLTDPAVELTFCEPWNGNVDTRELPHIRERIESITQYWQASAPLQSLREKYCFNPAKAGSAGAAILSSIEATL